MNCASLWQAHLCQDPFDFIHCVEAVDPVRLERTYVTGEAGRSLVAIESWPTDRAWAEGMRQVAAETLRIAARGLRTGTPCAAPRTPGGDPAADYLAEVDAITPEIRHERITLALEAGQISLARYLARPLPDTERERKTEPMIR